jgi:hypothetical protein
VMPATVTVGSMLGPSGEVVLMSNQAWNTAVTGRLPRPTSRSHAKRQDATRMPAASPTKPMAGMAR